ncbi:hypothetical protein HDU87_001380 [Geranomyces variabilis]|uniref:GST C-terminal domain-containing protein n=1 Tax=Geranomyces variabilis TaxID=109894 RepID=A0AAD5XS15_9FUNG|nr:hypothetical protein HDU87_001380 [Geranomyces variabilis]
MDLVRDLTAAHVLKGLGVVATLVAFKKTISFLTAKYSPPEKLHADNKPGPTDTVVLYQFPRPDNVAFPSLSPPCVKLEAYLRLCGVSYVNRFTIAGLGKSPMGTAPFISLNGVLHADSNLIIPLLEETGLSTGLSAHLTPVQQAQAHAIQCMVDDVIYHALVYERWQLDDNWASYKQMVFGKAPFFVKQLVAPMIRAKTVTALQAHKIGRHTYREVLEKHGRCIDALAVLLGDQEFFFGGERPSLVDVTVFAHLGCILALQIKTMGLAQQIRAKPNLVRLVERMAALTKLNA